jgi:hypothetical protein
MIQSNLRLCCALSWLLLSTEASLSVRRGAAVEPAEEAPWGHPTVSGELPWPVIERRLQQLTVVGNNGSPASAFPLGVRQTPRRPINYRPALTLPSSCVALTSKGM